MNAINYQKEMDKFLGELEGAGTIPRLFLHSCCAPCSSYCLEYLCRYFYITVFYYNPNISPEEEYCKRVAEQKRLIAAYNSEQKGYPIEIVEGDYHPQLFFDAVKGYEKCAEGGERCAKCFALRLEETARRAAAGGYDYFATTLTISPLKSAPLINSLGQQMGERYHVEYLASDFKKKNGYKRSVELSAEYDLYRQNFCGCIFSRMQSHRDEAT